MQRKGERLRRIARPIFGKGTLWLVPGLLFLPAAAWPDAAMRPSPRPSDVIAASRNIGSATLPRPVDRTTAFPQEDTVLPPVSPAFRRWRAAFRARALAAGIPPAVFDAAFRNVRPDPDIIARDRNQGEFTRQIWDYLDSAVSRSRIITGRRMLERHRRLLGRIERRYGVEKEIVVAIWGLESAYGARRGHTPVITALATLAHEGRRRRFFEGELLAALRILQAGDITPRRMTGSWAGAMGHTQFMPSSYLAFAEDFTGDGRRDIWSDDPADALASTANYLARHGWRKGQPWGVEVRLPEGFDYRLAGDHVRKPVGFWRARGLVRADGRPLAGNGLSDNDMASLRLPAGARGPALLTFDNFRVIERYNPADAYVIAVGHLADRIAGRPPFRASWPRGERALSAAEKRTLQERLTRQGYDTGGVDGIIGPRTIRALQAWQKDAGLVPDGFPSARLLPLLD